MLRESGAPLCSVSSTVYVPLSISPVSLQPSHRFTTAPFGGISSNPSWSLRVMLSWSASRPRLSVSSSDISLGLMSLAMSLPSTVSRKAGTP
ncbi:hypothetical protein D3C79_635040 [compost metagenome]